MITVKCMKTDQRVRLAIPKLVREAMQLEHGTTVQIEVIAPGKAIITNLDKMVADLTRKPAMT